MRKQCLNFFIFLFLFFYSNIIFAENIATDKTYLITQQISLLKTRIAQAQTELAELQKQQEHRSSNRFAAIRMTNELLKQAAMDITLARSNLDSISIELSESRQMVKRVEKEIEELQNQLNVSNIFGVKIVRSEVSSLAALKSELSEQKNLLQLENTRANSLFQLQTLAKQTLQLYQLKYMRMVNLMKAQAILQLKAEQAKTEIDFQQKQTFWLQQLNDLHRQMKLAPNSSNKALTERLERETFYVNENINFTYLQMLIVRYQDELQQFKLAVSHMTSITLLNKISDQVKILTNQVGRMDRLLQKRIDIVNERKQFILQETSQHLDHDGELSQLDKLNEQYKSGVTIVAKLTQDITAFQNSLDQALQQELASRHVLPGLGAKSWLDLGEDIMLVPTLTYHVVKSLIINAAKALRSIDSVWTAFLIVFELIWTAVFYFSRKWIAKKVSTMAEHLAGHLNFKRVGLQVLYRNLIEIGLVGNIIWLFNFFAIPSQSFSFLIQLGFVWILFKSMLMTARLCLVETVHDRDGHDVRLYRYLKWILSVGGVVTGMTIFVHQLPAIYELKDLTNRLFLLFLLVVSATLLRYWKLVPSILLPHISERRPYLKTVARILPILIPLILLINSTMGLFGFFNLVQTVYLFEGIFLVVLVTYLILKGLQHDGMEWISTVLIRHVNNGWLWTEAFLKPIDRVLQLILFLGAWVALFLLCGFNQQSRIFERFDALMHRQLAYVLNTAITPISILKLAVVISLCYWAARWTREFVYRFLASRTRDLGVRNSIAILSQYSVIVLGLFICLRVLGIDFRALTVVAGMFAFGVGLGLRDLFNNFACGFLLLLERPLRVGDAVNINGYEGEVMHIGGRAVTIQTWDHMEVIVPNAEIFSKSFTNWTARDNIIRTLISIKIDRHDDPQHVQDLIYHVLANHKDVLSDPIPEVFLKEMNESLVEFEVRYYINYRNVKSRFGVRSEVLMTIWEIFQENGIRPPYPHHQLHVKTGMPIGKFESVQP